MARTLLPPRPTPVPWRLLIVALALLFASPACIDDVFESGAGKSSDELLADAIDAAKPANTFESRKTDGVVCFNTFTPFKDAAKRAGRGTREGEQWHHIVNQHPANKARFGARLQCTDNLIRIPKHVHDAISGHYNSNAPEGGGLVREVIGKRSWTAQYEYGLDMLRQRGVEP
jgi:hypothetical protein